METAMSNSIFTDRLSELAAYSGDPWVPKNSYFAQAEEAMNPLWEKLEFPFISDCNFENVVDLAAGHGRNSEKLVEISSNLVIMDIQLGNVEVCKQRFDGNNKVTALVCSGYDMKPIPNSSQTLIYCFDAMVHFDTDVVRSYLRDTLRVLKPGGRGFYHHSNYTGGYDWRHNPHSRNFNSKELFGLYAHKEGLSIIKQ